MKLKQIMLSSFLVLVAVLGLNAIALSDKTLAADPPNFCDKITILKPLCDVTGSSGDKIQDNDIWKILVKIINILTDGIAIAAIGGFIFAGVLYSSAGGNADNTKKAKEIMQNIALGLLAYAAMYSLLNFIIPGGMFQV